MNDAGHATLTRRQLEVASFLRDGFGISEVAQRLVLSIHTVRGHVNGLHRATGTHDLISLAHWITVHEACCLALRAR